MRMRRPEFGIDLLHFAKQHAIAVFKSHRHLADLEIEHDFAGQRMLAKIPRRTQRRVPGKWQFFVDGEDAHLDAFALFDGLVARQNERRLAEVGLARQLLHLVVAKTARIGEHRQLIAFQRPGGEHIELNK